MSVGHAKTDRASMRSHLGDGPFDLVVAGGGATGLGVALDAVLRGLKVALFESHDFAKGTSSRATKLVHGGVRYLAQGRIGLVRESLRERSRLLHNAPRLVHPLPFIVPAYRFWELPFYASGLALYDQLAGRDGLGPTRLLGRRQTGDRLPGLRRQGLKGGVEYWDAQFDDAGLAVALAKTAAGHGALMFNYFPVTALVHEQGKIAGVVARDTETGNSVCVRARCVINATGVWVDAFRREDAKITGRPVRNLIRASRGTHVVVDWEFFPSDRALLVPRTSDGRVLFALPWQGKVMLGTTDIATDDLALDPCPDAGEIDYILHEAGRYLQTPPARRDIKSAWAGLRPLVDPAGLAGQAASSRRMTTKQISREHTIEISASGLVTVAGGKWTTYRAMAQDALESCARAGLLTRLPPCVTQAFALDDGRDGAAARAEVSVSAEENQLQAAGLSSAMVLNAARCDYALTVEDVLARRSRLLFLDAARAAQVAPCVARILQAETGSDVRLDDFLELAARYRPA